MAIVKSKIKARIEHIMAPKTGQYGPYVSVLFMRSDRSGEEAKVWRSFNPSEVDIFQVGMQVNLIPTTRKGKDTWDIEIIENADKKEIFHTVNRTENHVLNSEQKIQIASYIDQMGDLYKYCFTTAGTKLCGADEETIRAAASTLFIAAQRKFKI